MNALYINPANQLKYAHRRNVEALRRHFPHHCHERTSGMSDSNSTVKFCKKCNTHTDRGTQGQCKPCARERSVAYRLANPEKIKNAMQAWRDENKDHIKVSKASYRAANKEKEKASQAAYYTENKVKVKRATAAWRAKNALHISEYAKRKWQEIKETVMDKKRIRYKSDPVYAMRTNVRNRTNAAFKANGFAKKSKTHELLGCEWCVLKIHIEKQFLKGMSWENKSEWHIDHIIPLASAKSIEEIVMLCHFTNLRPMWAMENFKKNSKNVFLI